MKNFSDRNKGLVLFGLALLIYGWGINREFVFDDVEYIATNAVLHGPHAFRAFWFSTETFNYYPLFWSLLRVQWLLWGDHSSGYHAVNLLVHCTNAVLVWRVGRAWRLPGAWWVGAMFAVHPVNVQTLAWAAEQKNTWSFLFMAIAVLLLIKCEAEKRSGAYWFSLLSFAAALACKTSVVALPVFLAVCYGVDAREKTASRFVRLLPFFVLSIAAGATTLWFEKHRVFAGSAIAKLAFGERLKAAGSAFWFYFWKALCPVGLTPMYRGWVDITAAAHGVWPAIAALAFVALCAVFWRRLGAVTALGIFYYAVMLLPLLGVFDTNYFIYSTVADHWQYHALPGLLFAVSAGFHRVFSRDRSPVFANIAAAGSIAAFAVLAAFHFAHFEDARTLWSYVISKNPDAWIAWYNIGNIYSEDHDYPRAIDAYQEALRVKPNHYGSRFNLGNALAAADRNAEADEIYAAAEKLGHPDPDLPNNRGVVLLKLGRDDEAAAEFRHALQLDPRKASARVNLVVLLVHEGRLDEATQQLDREVCSGINSSRIAAAIRRNLEQRISPIDALKTFAQHAVQLSGDAKELREIRLALEAATR